MTIVDELIDRRILRLKPGWMASDGYITCSQGMFGIAINIFDPPHQQILTLGHEIGHTFHLDCDAEDPFHLYRHLVTRKCRSPDVEDFCEAFGMKWADLHSRSELLELVALLSRNKPLILNEARCMRSDK
jgi:hypothetical protein